MNAEITQAWTDLNGVTHVVIMVGEMNYIATNWSEAFAEIMAGKEDIIAPNWTQQFTFVQGRDVGEPEKWDLEAAAIAYPIAKRLIVAPPDGWVERQKRLA